MVTMPATLRLRFVVVLLAISAALVPGHAQDLARRSLSEGGAGQNAPLRLAIAGLVHGHVTGFLRAAQARQDVQIVGVFEPDAALRQKYAERYSLPASVLFDSLAAMLDRAKPEAVAAFTNTADHPAVVEAAAAHHV